MYRYVNKIFYRVAYVIAIFISMIAFYLWNFPQLGYTLWTNGFCLYNHGINQGTSDDDVCWGSASATMMMTTVTTPRLICTEDYVVKISNDKVILPLLGVVCGQLMTCSYRCIYCIIKYVSTINIAIEYRTGGMQYICMYMMMIVLTIIQVCSVMLIQFDVIRYSCKDFLGVESSPYYWIDWICTVPLMFFLVAMVDADALNFHLSYVIIEALAGVSILLLFLTNFPLPIYINTILFTASNICMGIALIRQHKLSRDKFFIEDKLLKRIPKYKRYDTAHALKKELFLRAQSKCHLSLYFLFTFPLFPLLYYLRLFRFIDVDTYFIIMIAIKICSKAGFTHMLSMINLEAFDPIKLVLIEQKRDHDHSRLAFIRYIVHELRGPLNSIALGLHVLTESSSSLVDSEDDIMDAIQEGTKHMTDTLRDVLTLQLIEDGQIELKMESFQPDLLLIGALSSFQSQLAAKNLNVLVQIYKDVPQHITGDKHRLKHVIDNLLSNAIKFCPDDSDICLSISYDNKFKDSVTFAVRDQGPGITNEDRKLLFEPFMVVRPGELRQGRGSGLGLSISRYMVELHAGSLDCASAMRMDNGDITSGGTELSFTVPMDSSSNVVHDDDDALPMLNPSSDSMTGIMSCEMLSKKNRYCKCDEERALQVLAAARVLSQQQQQQQQQLTTQAETVSRALDMSEKLVDVLIDQDEVCKTERILIVDDVQSNRKMLQLLLKRRGFTLIDQCENGKEAVDCVSAKGNDYYDLIFLDNLMPIMTGPQAAVQLRSNGCNNPIVGLTGNSLAEDIADFEAAGADVVIIKPMRVQCLDRIVRYCDLQRTVHGGAGEEKKEGLVMQKRRGRDDDDDVYAHKSLKEFLASCDDHAVY